MSNATAALDSLFIAGKTLIFCDDTDMVEPPQPGYASNIRLLAGVVLPSEKYAEVASTMTSKLGDLGVTEFHATEIVNPNKDSSWYQISYENRIAAFGLLREFVLDAVTGGYYLQLPADQYNALRVQAQEIGKVSVGHKHALKRVFLRALFERFAPSEKPVAIVLDQDTPLTVPRVENMNGGEFLVGGGPISASSISIPGLQLADMFAYCIARYLRKQKILQHGTGSAFDMIAAETLGGMYPNVKHLLNKEV